MEILIETLEASVKKNGSIPLTTGHLLNILKMVEREMEKQDRISDMSGFHPDWD